MHLFQNDKFWRGDGTGCIFFYVGNEGDVELYANHTGLMWENAEEHGALLVFAEHRYYGQSMPLGALSATNHDYLSSSQALADYASLLRSIRANFSTGDAPAIAFGGSYGGVLAALFRAGWPSSVAGAIAASAPLRSFPGQMPAFDSALYYEVISRNVGVAGGSPAACAVNIRATWPVLFADGTTDAGRARLSKAFRTCKPVSSSDDTKALAFWLRAAFDSLSMANYPYPSDYISFPATLPAFPVRAACEALKRIIDPATNTTGLYEAMAEAAGTLYNVTRDVRCNDIPPNPNSHPADPYDGQWDYQQCTEMQPDSQWFETREDVTVFWNEPRNLTYL
jgi:lysosomal Pro-X carboxypeptidase